jgi:hypothetical protein
MVHGLDRGCPAIPRHPHERYQMCYQEGKRQRSAGIFPPRRRALAKKRAIERGRTELAMAVDFDLEQLARTLFGDRRDEVVAGPEGPALHRPSTVPART